MNTRKIFLFICYLILAIVLSSVIKTAIEGEKGKVKRVIFSGKRAVEKEDLARLSGYLSFDYQDKYGNDRSAMLFIGRGVFREYQDIILQIEDLKIELDKSEAVAQMEVLILARSSARAQNEKRLEYDRVKLKVNFKKEEAGWKVIELEFLEPEKAYPLKGFVPLSKIRYLKR